MPRPVSSAIVVAALMALAGCSTAKSVGDKLVSPFVKKEVPVESKSPDAIYSEAETLLADGNEVSAARMFDEVERLYPYSPRAKQAMLMSSEAYFQGARYDEAILAAERYLDLYPSGDGAARARAIIADSYYERITDPGRDQEITEQAETALRDVIGRSPDSPYARDAALKLDLTQDQLAGKEMEVGRYYLERGHYLAAVNRFRGVVENYDTTSHVPEALHRLVEGYLGLGLESEARAAAAVLGHNYPGSPWYEDSYALMQGDVAPGASPGGWWDNIYRRVVKGQTL